MATISITATIPAIAVMKSNSVTFDPIKYSSSIAPTVSTYGGTTGYSSVGESEIYRVGQYLLTPRNGTAHTIYGMLDEIWVGSGISGSITGGNSGHYYSMQLEGKQNRPGRNKWVFGNGVDIYPSFIGVAENTSSGARKFVIGGKLLTHNYTGDVVSTPPTTVTIQVLDTGATYQLTRTYFGAMNGYNAPEWHPDGLYVGVHAELTDFIMARFADGKPFRYKIIF